MTWQWMPAQEAADALGLHRSTVDKRCCRGWLEWEVRDGLRFVHVDAPVEWSGPPLLRWWEWHPLSEFEGDVDGDELAAALARPLVAVFCLPGGGGGGVVGGCGEGAPGALGDGTREVA